MAAVVLLFGAIFLSQALSRLKTPPDRHDDNGQAIPQVEVINVQNEAIRTTLEIQGELVAYDKIDLFAEVSGTLKPNGQAFKVGNYFAKGSILLSIDDEETKLNLLSQKSSLLNSITQLMPDLKIDYPESFEQWQAYLEKFDVENPLQDFPNPLKQSEKYFIASRNLYTQFYNIKSAETRLSKYTIYAPFSGVLTEANINPGTLVRQGQKLGVLMNSGSYELQATIPLRELKFIKTGSPVELSSDEIDGKWTGRVKRISNQIDRGTQTVMVFIGLSGKNLRENMYLHGKIAIQLIEKAISIPRLLLINETAVYEVRNGSLKLHPVEVVKITENKAIVKGLEEGIAILKVPVGGAFEGMKVRIRSLGHQVIGHSVNERTSE